jgi:hypothetical protein
MSEDLLPNNIMQRTALRAAADAERYAERGVLRTVEEMNRCLGAVCRDAWEGLALALPRDDGLSHLHFGPAPESCCDHAPSPAVICA